MGFLLVAIKECGKFKLFCGSQHPSKVVVTVLRKRNRYSFGKRTFAAQEGGWGEISRSHLIIHDGEYLNVTHVEPGPPPVNRFTVETQH